MSNWRSFELAQITDVRGNLTVIEGAAHIPFEIARAFYIYDVPSGSARLDEFAPRMGETKRELNRAVMVAGERLVGGIAVHL
jgi:WxcM-like, C-terminal